MDYLGTEIPDDVYEYLKNDDFAVNYDYISIFVNKFIEGTHLGENKFDINIEYIQSEIRKICNNRNYRTRLFKYIVFIEETKINKIYYKEYFKLLYEYSKIYNNFDTETIIENLRDSLNLLNQFNIKFPNNSIYNYISNICDKIRNYDYDKIKIYVKNSMNDVNKRLEPYLIYDLIFYIAPKYIDNLLEVKSKHITNKRYTKIISLLRSLISYNMITSYTIDIENVLNLKEDI